MQLYSDKRTRPRQKTRAKDVLKAVDDHQTFFGGAMDDELALDNMAYSLGMDPELAKTYNRGGKTTRDNLAWNQTEADKWWDSATPHQKADQYDGAKAKQAYEIAEKSVGWGIDYTDDHPRDNYADISSLPRGKLNHLLNGTPEERRAVIRETNAQVQPWNPAWRDDAERPSPYSLGPAPGSNTEAWDDTDEADTETALGDDLAEGRDGDDTEPDDWRPGMLTPVSENEIIGAAFVPVSEDEEAYEDPNNLGPKDVINGSANSEANSATTLQSQYGFQDEERIADGGHDPEESRRDTDTVLPMRYGNYGGHHWTNGRNDSDARVNPTDDIDDTGQNKLKPIDILDAAFMRHDHAYGQADDEIKAGNKAAASARRRQADLALLARLEKIQKRFLAGELKLGIKGSGFDSRTDLLKVNKRVDARHMLDAAIFYFRRKTQDNHRKPDSANSSGGRV